MRYHILSLICSLIFSFTLYAANLVTDQSDTNIKNINNYVQSGQYLQDINHKLKYAKDYLNQQASSYKLNKFSKKTKAMAIVLDIDDTALSNYQNLQRTNFTNSISAFTAAFLFHDLEPVEPVLDLYNLAIENKIKVFFVSERDNTPEIMQQTANNLKKAGYIKYDAIILKPTNQDSQSIADFKTNARKQIAAQNIDIILNIGDQNSDLSGGYQEVKIKLPNPFYTLS